MKTVKDYRGQELRVGDWVQVPNSFTRELELGRVTYITDTGRIEVSIEGKLYTCYRDPREVVKA